jgi:hypothetical protein
MRDHDPQGIPGNFGFGIKVVFSHCGKTIE